MCFSNNNEAPPPPPPPPAAPLTVDGESHVSETTASGPTQAEKDAQNRKARKKRRANHRDFHQASQAKRKSGLANIQKKSTSYKKGAQANMSKRG